HLQNACESCRDAAFMAVRPYEVEAGGAGGRFLSVARGGAALGRVAKNPPGIFSLTAWGTPHLWATARFPQRTITPSCVPCWTAPCTRSSRWESIRRRPTAPRIAKFGTCPNQTRKPRAAKRFRNSSDDQTPSRSQRAERVLLGRGRRRG